MTKIPLGGVGEDGLLRCPEVLVELGRMESLDMELGYSQSAYGNYVLALNIWGSILEMSWMPVLLLECVYHYTMHKFDNF